MRLVDRIAYINHDIDDALRAGILRFEQPAAGRDRAAREHRARTRIETLVRDLLERSEDAGDIVQGEEVGGAMLRLREFMFDERVPRRRRAAARSRGSSGCCGRCSSTSRTSRRPR